MHEQHLDVSYNLQNEKRGLIFKI